MAVHRDSAFVDQQIVSGDDNYLHARAGAQGRSGWYRYTGGQADGGPVRQGDKAGVSDI